MKFLNIAHQVDIDTRPKFHANDLTLLVYSEAYHLLVYLITQALRAILLF